MVCTTRVDAQVHGIEKQAPKARGRALSVMTMAVAVVPKGRLTRKRSSGMASARDHVSALGDGLRSRAGSPVPAGPAPPRSRGTRRSERFRLA
jgi:hypothetical protein